MLVLRLRMSSLLMWVGVWLVNVYTHIQRTRLLVVCVYPCHLMPSHCMSKTFSRPFSIPSFLKDSFLFIWIYERTDGHILSLWQLKRSHSICAHQIFIDCSSTLLGSLLVIGVQSARKFSFSLQLHWHILIGIMVKEVTYQLRESKIERKSEKTNSTYW